MATDDGEEQTTMECFEKGEDRAKKSNTSNKLELDITGSSAMQMKQSCHILLVHVPKAIEFNIQRQKGYTGHIAVLVFRVEEFYNVQVLKLFFQTFGRLKIWVYRRTGFKSCRSFFRHSI